MSTRGGRPLLNTEYEILVCGELGTLIHTETGITGISWTYLDADERLDSGLERLNTRILMKTARRLRLRSENSIPAV